jgi:hypothetical protein
MKYDLVEDIRNSPEIMAKIRADDRRYAQNLYAAWCNMQWCPKQFWPILRQDPDKDLWSASWRGAGGIVANLRNKGEDYMDYYCSGMGGFATYDLNEGEEYMAKTGYVPEGQVTDEIAEDFNKLGWFPVPYDDDMV